MHNKLGCMQIINADFAPMDIAKLKIFVAVYRARSFAEVAKQRNVAASSISRTIAGLEEELGLRLFQRTTRTLNPTQAAERYYLRMEPLLEEFDLAQQEALGETLQPSGLLRVSASSSFGQLVLAPLLAKFQQAYPKIQLELDLSDSRVDLIAQQFDLVLRHGVLNDSSLVARKLLDVNYLLVASSAYLKRSAKIQQPFDVTDHNLIGFTYRELNKQWLFSRGKTSQKIAITPSLSLSSAAAIKECVNHDMGLALLADWTVREDLKSGKLVQVLSDWQVTGANSDSAIWLLYPSRAFMPNKVAVFSQFLLDNLQSV
ncbi:LysR family transcriptional regulator [Agarivorans sp. B2Z047]|uniref:LysR family transcriptional regulator n=1 Tax=Agarivorans sp. B2Z047 TaxID=2652721 RepID=UPI00128B33B1|nr:LysR family transcriptional regulator [Agarivorans sp. B2Z047]MPW29169.1 LysR family transcriptional regulator [Agarivorans sp. B2Z047]UQN41723.1 LysR family transcriptional regulator [Agarivorans sp. B2Z047]